MIPKPPSKELLESIAWHQEEARKAFRTAVLSNYIVDPEDAKSDKCQYLVPARLVYRKIADDFAVDRALPEFKKWVAAAIHDLGGIKYTYNGHTFFRGIRPVGICEAESKAQSLEYKREARFEKRHPPRELGYIETTTRHNTSLSTWEKILAKEGLPKELSMLGLVDPLRADLNKARIEVATTAMWRVYRDFCILRLYLDGASILVIADRLKIGRKLVWNRLKHYDLTTTDK